jgi:hypothetical protein
LRFLTAEWSAISYVGRKPLTFSNPMLWSTELTV